VGEVCGDIPTRPKPNSLSLPFRCGEGRHIDRPYKSDVFRSSESGDEGLRHHILTFSTKVKVCSEQQVPCQILSIL
jgi:hypothetical protein